MRLTVVADEYGIGFSIGRERAGRNGGKGSTRRAALCATRALACCRNRGGRTSAGEADAGRLSCKAAGLQKSAGSVPAFAHIRRGRRPWSRFELGGDLGAEGIRVGARSDFVEQHVEGLNSYVLYERSVSVEGGFDVKSFRIQVGISGDLSALPQVGELAAGGRKPIVSDRV